MLIKTHSDGFIHRASSEITPRSVYEGRRDLMKLLAGGVAGAALASWAARDVVKAVRHGRWSVAREQAKVVGRYGLNRPGAVVENAAELVTGRNRDAR